MKRHLTFLAAAAITLLPASANAQAYNREHDSGIAGLGLCTTWSQSVIHPYPCFWLIYTHGWK